MSDLRFLNTKTRQVDTFKAINPREVKVYTCGPTVYGPLHLGNWLAYIRWDLLIRVLKLNGYQVRRVLNITDVGHLVSDGDEGEDKLEVGAKRENLTAYEVARRYEADFKQGLRNLNLLEPDLYARATDYIDQQIALIKSLESAGAVYEISDGIYFDTSKFPAYAEFARLDLSSQTAGARVKENPEKKQPWDFALWKFSPRGKKRDMEWASPWGKGFPGWHLECSAIILELLGETIDIHTGGIDHIPVHHTNEIAQSETATNKPLANFWLHNNFLRINDEKISKSLNNGITLNDLADKGYSAFDFKMMALQSHYRSESNFSWHILEAAKQRLKQLNNFAVLRYQPNSSANPLDDNYFNDKRRAIIGQLNDDLATPAALALINEVIDQVISNGKGIYPTKGISQFNQFLEFLDEALGFNLLEIDDINLEQKKLLQERLAARKSKNFAQSDSIRDELSKQGISVEDHDDFSFWSYS